MVGGTGADAGGWGACWWSGGRTLTERPASGEGSGSAGSDDAERRARVRLDRWRSEHGSARRLASVGLDGNDLLRLLRERSAGGPKPAWAVGVERVVDRAVGPAVVDGRSWQSAFAVVVKPFVQDARSRVAAAVADLGDAFVDADDVVDRFADALRRTLVWTATRTLVLELNVARVTGLLDGDSPEERFAAFALRAGTRAGRTALLTEYPVLARLLWQHGDVAVAAFTELLHRYAADRADVVRDLLGGRDPGPLARVDTGAGDAHHGGRSVAVLAFADGTRVVCKPRPSAVHRHFNQVVGWLNSVLPGLDLRTLGVLDRGDRTWTEFAAHHQASDTAQVESFHHRLGALLAVLHVLDATDQHFENVVACGDQPVLVDVETLFHPAWAHRGLADDPAARALESSVLRTALLPRPTAGANGVLDISGVGGDQGAALPDDVVGFDGAGTDRMRLVRGPEVFGGAENRPRLDGVDVDPGEYVEHLVAGFRAAYDAVRTHRADLLAPGGPVDAFATDVVRVVVRDTAEYARLLDESTHPDVLRDALDRDRVFGHLWTSEADPARERLVEHEVADLWAGDVPLFTTTPTSHDILTAQGVRVPDALAETGLDRVRGKIRAMGPADLRTQEWVLRASFATRGDRGAHPARPRERTADGRPDPERLLAAARAVADALLADAHDDGRRVNWIGLEHDRSWEVLPLGASLTGGFPGVALFLGQLAGITGEQRWADVARRSVGPVPSLLDRLGSAEAAAPTGVAGLGGLAYALSHLAVLLDDPDLRDWTATAVDVAAAHVERDGTADLLGGTAGCLAAMLAVHRTTGLDSAWRAASACAGLLRRAEGPPTTGFAHGTAGTTWALWRFAVAAGDPCPRSPVLADSPEADDATWCHGATGIGLARADILALQRDRGGAEAFDRAVDDVLRLPPSTDHSLCHGELGTLELITAAAARGHGTATAEAPRRLGGLLSSIDRNGPVAGTPDGVRTPGLLNGLAGIGHGLLRLGHPDRVPAVLLLDAAEPRH
ncbi:MAG: type 2 lanthipeptide synthetase LanM family protein [Umezawaea sp.]